MLQYTKWPSLYEIDTYKEVEEKWEDTVTALSSHSRVIRKDAAEGFGPYILRMPANACKRHQDARERKNQHRCDLCVDRLTLAVYDVDTGTPEEVRKCDELLMVHGIIRLWYSTHSHTVDKPSYRLVIPLATPIPAEDWPSFRLSLLNKYAIPADPSKCSGRSHFYFLPSCRPDAEPEVWHGGREMLEPASVGVVEARKKVRFATLEGFEWQPPASSTSDFEQLRDSLQRRVKALARRGDKLKAEILRKLLRGDALAQEGSRNNATFQAAGMLAWAVPGEPLATYQALLRSSVVAMQQAGSSLTDADVERMLLTAMRNQAEKSYLQRKTIQNINAELEAYKQQIRAACKENGGTQ